jgi:hypothetical protein
LRSNRRNFKLSGPAPPTTEFGSIGGLVYTFDNQQLHGPEVFNGEVILSVQPSYIRGKGVEESEAAYDYYLSTIERRVVASAELDPNRPGLFQFDNVMVYERDARGALVSLDYSVEVRRASALQYLLDEDGERIPDGNGGEVSIALEFFDQTVFNVRPSEPNDVQFDVDMLMNPVGELAIKRDLVTKLQAQAENAYKPTEMEVATYLDGFSDGTFTLEGARLEGIKRAVWAERSVFFASDAAEQLLSVMADAASNMAGDVFDLITTWGGKDLKDAKEDLERVTEAKDAILDRVSKYPSADVGQTALTIQQELARLDGAVGVASIKTSQIADWLTQATNASSKYLTTAMAGLGADNESIATARTAILAVWKTVLDVLRFQSIGSVSRTGLKLALEESTKLLVAEGLFDPPPPLSSVLPAWTPEHTDDLESSRDQMMSWAGDDALIYALDRDLAIAALGPALTGAAASLARAGEFLAYAQASDAISDVSDLIGNFSAVGKFFKVLFEAGKWGFNIAAFADPAFYAYSVLDDSATQAVSRIYGGPLIPFGTQRAGTSVATARITANASLLTDVQQSADDFAATMTEITDAIAEDRIFDVLELVSGDGEPTLVGSIAEFVTVSDRFLAQSAAVETIPDFATGIFADLILNSGEFLAHRIVTVASLRNLYLAALLDDYTGPDDSTYKAHRDVLLNDLAAMNEVADDFVSLAGKFATETSGDMFTPVIWIDSMTAVSQSTGDPDITESPETFRVETRIKNISSESVAMLSARLLVSSTNNSAILLDTAEQPIAAGILIADDGIPGSGDDEAVLTWNIQYVGDLLESDPIALTIEVLEAGAAPETFIGDPRNLVVVRSIDLIDGDADGLPDHYERANGLDPTTDDSAADLDEDGAGNLKEYNIGTDVGEPDTDGDTLSDGEEITPGADGYLTDPLLTDTDGDGVNDALDGEPTDGNITDPTPPPAEPIVAVAETSVVLDQEIRLASVAVSNAGGGVLQWTAQTNSPLFLSVTPDAPDFVIDGTHVTIALRDGVDASVLESLSATVMVTDVGAGVHDTQTIEVTVLPDATVLFCGHTNESSAGGNITATDALVALNAAVGATSCALCRCDVDDSGSISATDALRILTAAVGLDVTLTCSPC